MVFNRRCLYDYILLIRPLTLIAPFVLGIVFSLTIAFLSNTHVSLVKVFLIGLSLGILHASSQPINQIFDIDVDRVNKPERPLVRGVIGIFEAVIVALILFVSSIIFAVFVNEKFLFSILLLSFFAYFYSVPPLKIKRRGVFTSLVWLALSKGFMPIVLISYTLLDKITTEAIFLGMIFFLWVFATQPSKDFNDFKGDKLVGIKTLPTVYGIDKAKKFVKIFIWSPFIALTIFLLFNLINFFYSILYLATPLAIYIYLKIDKLLGNRAIENNNLWLLFYLGYIYLASLALLSSLISSIFSSS